MGDGKDVTPNKDRSRMLTVRKLIDFLKTCNPDACVLGFEMNSNAYIEQLPKLPNHLVCTVADDKKSEFEHLSVWFKDVDDAEKKIKKEMETIYRYSKDDDVVIRMGT